MKKGTPKQVTIREIARQAGTSHATVSYVLRNQARQRRIPPATEERVREIAEQLGWQPNYVLSSFATGKTRLIGMWQRGFGEPYHAWVLQTMEKILHKDGYAMLVSPARTEKGDSEEEYDLNLFARWSVDGLISLGGMNWMLDFAKKQPAAKFPLIHIGSFPVPEENLLDSVYVDVITPARQALVAWVQEGRKRIAMLSGQDTDRSISHPRETMYQQFVAEFGLKEEMIAFPKGESQRLNAEKTLHEYVAGHGCPAAFFCRSDETLMGAARALRKLGKKVPEDVALLGIDGIQDTRYLGHPVQTVVQPVEAMCNLAWELLQDRLENPDRPARCETLQGTLEWRE